jgi:uncharacterized protein DUF2784
MWYSWLADLILCIHAGFVLFVICGGLLVLRWRRIAWLHLPAATWGAIVEFGGWVCPLTPLENWLRQQAGESGYRSDFVAYYLWPVLYPDGLTRDVQLMLGTAVLAINVSLYGWLWRRSQ